MSGISRMNETRPSQTSFITKIELTFPYDIFNIATCGKILFEGIKIEGEPVVCVDRGGCYTSSIQQLREEWRKCDEEVFKLRNEELKLQKKLRIAIFGWKKMKEKINELNRLYEEKRKNCDALFKELNEKTNKLQSELRRVFHEKMFEIIIKPYLMATSITNKEINKLRATWVSAVETVSRMCTPMSIPIPIPKGICKVSIVTNTYGVAPHMYTIKKYIVEIYTSYNYDELKAFIDALMQQYRDLINAGCLTISTDVV